MIDSTCIFLLDSMRLRSTTIQVHAREELTPLKGETSLRGSGAVVVLTLRMVDESTSESASLGNRILLLRGLHKS